MVLNKEIFLPKMCTHMYPKKKTTHQAGQHNGGNQGNQIDLCLFYNFITYWWKGQDMQACEREREREREHGKGRTAGGERYYTYIHWYTHVFGREDSHTLGTLTFPLWLHCVCDCVSRHLPIWLPYHRWRIKQKPPTYSTLLATQPTPPKPLNL